MGRNDTTTTAEPQLRHLTLHDRLYAEADHGRFYALRGRSNTVWTLVARDREFAPKTFPNVQACDAALGVWLAVQTR
jgi:hypothetical protein